VTVRRRIESADAGKIRTGTTKVTAATISRFWRSGTAGTSRRHGRRYIDDGRNATATPETVEHNRNEMGAATW
jgi:hypothetical protein